MASDYLQYRTEAFQLTVVVERDRKKAEKQAKFEQKKAKVASTASAPPSSKNKEKKAKVAEKAEEEVLPEYIEDTLPGEKKGKFS